MAVREKHLTSIGMKTNKKGQACVQFPDQCTWAPGLIGSHVCYLKIFCALVFLDSEIPRSTLSKHYLLSKTVCIEELKKSIDGYSIARLFLNHTL